MALRQLSTGSETAGERDQSDLERQGLIQAFEFTHELAWKLIEDFLDAHGREIEEDFHLSMSGYYYRHELKGMHYGEFCNYADYFASKLLSGEPNSPDLDEGLEPVAVMRAIVASLESGVPTRV